MLFSFVSFYVYVFIIVFRQRFYSNYKNDAFVSLFSRLSFDFSEEKHWEIKLRFNMGTS